MNILKNKMPNENEDDNNNYKESRYKTYTVERKYEPKEITKFDNSNNLREGKPIITEEIINDGNKKIRKYEKKQNYQDGNTYKESHVQIIEETNNGNNNDIKFNYYKDIKDNFDDDEKEFEDEFNRKHYNFKTYNPDTKNMKNSGPIVREEIINDGNKKIRKYEKKESKNNGDTIHESHYEEVVEESNNNNIPQSNYYKSQKKTYKSNKVQNNYYDDKFNNDFMDSNLDKITDHIDDEDFEREVQKMENQLNNELNNFGNNYQNYSSKTYSKVYKKNYNNNNYIDNQDEFNNDNNNNNDFNNDNRSTTTQYSNTYNNSSYKKKKY
jgi:hypothetical protein